MTLQQTNEKKKSRNHLRLISRKIPLFALAVLFLMLFFLRNSALAKEAVLEGFRRAVLGVLPSVFPFLVLSDLLVAAGGLPQKMSALLCPLLRLPPCACAAILAGWICGFPVGAVYAAKEVGRGNLSPTDAERAAVAASIPSPAFLISAVGSGLLQDAVAGVLLWVSCVLSAATVCAFFGKKGGIYRKIPQKTEQINLAPFFKSLTDAIRNAAGISVNLCAFVAFFSVLIAALKAVFARFGLSPVLGFSVAALLEISNGIYASSVLPSPLLLPLCAAACGWSGFSVHFQIFSVLGNLRLHYGKFLLAKALQSVLCFLIVWIIQLLR